VIKVSRTGARQDTRYTVSLVEAPAPVPGFTTVGQVLQQAAPTQRLTQVAVVVDEQSKATANRWVELGYNLLAKKEFIEMVAKEVQRLKDEGLWA
jgi:ABC-type phosphate transport system auxiliary subunit